jgi:thiol-disulfide isomerase/thioredoxin
MHRLAIVLALAVLLTACGGGSSSPSPSPPASASIGSTAATPDVTVEGAPRTDLIATGEPIPAYSAPGLDGATVSWTDRQGSPTLLVVWAPWCPHCQVELPIVQRVASDYPGVAVTSIASAIGQSDGPTPQEYVADNGITFPVAVDDGNMTLLKALGVTGFPTIYMVDADGNVVDSRSGEVPETDLRAALASLQAGARSSP